MKSPALALMITLSLAHLCFAQPPTPGQIERSIRILDQEEDIRKKITAPEKTFIQDIAVEGVTLLTDDEVKEITLPFEKKWLTQNSIEEVLSLIKQAYKQKGYPGQPAKISYQVKNEQLIIQIKELKP